MKLTELFQQGKFVITSENGPPKGTDVTEMLENAELLRGRVDAMNITDQQSSVMRLGSLAACRLLKQRGIEPVFQVTCRDRNRIALQSDLLSAAVLGIENVLCLTGDYVGMGDHPDAKPVFDLDSVSLLETVRRLRERPRPGERGAEGQALLLCGGGGGAGGRAGGAPDHQDGEEGEGRGPVLPDPGRL